MNQAILRSVKLATSSKQGSANKHNRREVEVKNADPDGVHITLIGEGKSIPELVDARIEAAGIKPRKNAMKAQELVLSVSPEYFRPDRPGAWGKYDPARLDAWQSRTVAFLEKEYGENLVSLDLHLDEATPHLHAVVVPIMEYEKKRRGKDEWYTVTGLNADKMFNPKGLSELQDKYHAPLEELGIQRGVKGSKAKHERIKRHYTAVNSPVSQAPQIPPVTFTELPSKSVRWSDAKLMDWLNMQAERIQEGLRASVERMADQLNTYRDQALAYEKKWQRSQSQLLAMCKEFKTPEGVRAALDAKDAQIASQSAVIESKDQTLADNKVLFGEAQSAIEGLQNDVKTLTYENHKLTKIERSQGVSKGVDL